MPETIYKDISERTGGDIYIGVVGPVRTGKSTFIRRFMETAVLPNIADESDKKRAQDALPQSGSGKSVMTAEPKFVPEKAVEVTIDKCRMRMRLVDCVGFVVSGAQGIESEDGKRMVRTPWHENAVPFDEAAKYGTEKVITDHSTVSLLVTTDGSVCGIGRQQYEEAEETTVSALKARGLPFAIVLNCADVRAESARRLALSLEEKYGVSVALVNCLELDEHDVRSIMGLILKEFPVSSVAVRLPAWLTALDREHPIMSGVRETLLKAGGGISKVGQIEEAFSVEDDPYIDRIALDEINMGTGDARLELFLKPGLYFSVLSEFSGIAIESEKELFECFKALSETKKKYDRVASALNDASEKGYGIVIPEMSDLRLEEPCIVRHAGGFGVRIKATAPSIHMIRATVETELSPVVGTEQQSEDLVNYLRTEAGQSPDGIWSTNLLGKSLYDMVSDGLNEKLGNMPPDAREKMAETLSRIVNEGSGGLICIIL